MIIQELFSEYKRSQDQLFLYWAYGQLLTNIQSKKDSRSQFATLTMNYVLHESNLPILRSLAAEKKLLESHRELEDFFRKGDPTLSNFVPKPKDTEALGSLGLRVFPAFMAEWNASSRRVFQLGSDTQRLLEVTEYHELESDDVIIPFPNFVVRLAEPVSYMGRKFTAVGFSQELLTKEAWDRGPSAWGYILLCNDDTYQSLSERKKEKLVEDMKKTKKTGHVLATLSNLMPVLTQAITPMIITTLEEKSLPSIQIGDRTNTENVQTELRIHSIMINLMAVMGRLGKRGLFGKSINGELPEGISSTKNVFDISSLSALEDVIDGEKTGVDISYGSNKRKITPHWRRKHLRRRPGMGHIPDAPKDVKVPATLVLGDFLEQGTLPIGTITKI